MKSQEFKSQDSREDGDKSGKLKAESWNGEEEAADPFSIHNLRSTICNPSFLRSFVFKIFSISVFQRFSIYLIIQLASASEAGMAVTRTRQPLPRYPTPVPGTLKAV